MVGAVGENAHNCLEVGLQVGLHHKSFLLLLKLYFNVQRSFPSDIEQLNTWKDDMYHVSVLVFTPGSKIYQNSESVVSAKVQVRLNLKN